MNGAVICVFVVGHQLELALQHSLYLRMDVMPFAHAQMRDEVFFAPVAQLGFRQLRALRLIFKPQLQQRQKVRVLVLPRCVLLVSLGLLVDGPVARVGHAQRRHNDRHFGQTLFTRAGQQDARQSRIHRQCGQLAAQFGQRVVAAQCAQFLQRALTVTDVTPIRRLDERKAFDVAQAQRMHLQDDRCQVGALYLRVGVLRPHHEVVFAVQAYGDARAHASAATRALVGRGARDLFDGQPLQTTAMAIAADARMTGVDDGAYAGHSQRCFGHVGGQNYASPARGPEHALLFFLCQP